MNALKIKKRTKAGKSRESSHQKVGDGSLYMRGISPTSGGTSSFYSTGPLLRLKPMVQPKLTINKPNDRYEQEAGRVADQVMRMPGPKRSLERNENNVPGIKSGKAGGQPLPKSSRDFFEPRFGADFSGVRVYTDSKAAETAQSINAKAFTRGKDIVFAKGQYSPGTKKGNHLIAHELAHVVQQNSNLSRIPSLKGSQLVIGRSPYGAIQRRVRFKVLEWDAQKITPPPEPTNHDTDNSYIEIPPTGQILINARVQVKGRRNDPCPFYEIGTTQTAWMASCILHYQGPQGHYHGRIRISYKPSVPIRDPHPFGNIWYNTTIVTSPDGCGASVRIQHVDSPGHKKIPKALPNRKVFRRPLNFLRSYHRKLHLVTYLTTRNPGGKFRRRPLRYIYWNSIQRFNFTPQYRKRFGTIWPYSGPGIKVNIGAKGRGPSPHVPYYTTSGPNFNDHANNEDNWSVKEFKKL